MKGVTLNTKSTVSTAPPFEFVLQGYYSHGWEDLCSEDTREEAREQLKCYRDNEGGTYRIIRRATKGDQ